jgi:hypothetical protein
MMKMYNKGQIGTLVAILIAILLVGGLVVYSRRDGLNTARITGQNESPVATQMVTFPNTGGSSGLSDFDGNTVPVTGTPSSVSKSSPTTNTSKISPSQSKSTGSPGETNNSTVIVKESTAPIPQGSVSLTSGVMLGNVMVGEGQKNVELVRIVMTAPAESDAVVNELILSSNDGNRIFNYVENFKLQSPSGSQGLLYGNAYSYTATLWKLSSPIYIPRGTSVALSVWADVKPSLPDSRTVSARVVGGGGSMSVMGSALGRSIQFVR